MDWTAGIQRALDYIEENLATPLDIHSIAAVAHASPFHFQRVFHILSGFTVAEYIRMRRLTLAAAELQATGAKITSTALKYGYDTPESFSRAFQRFHGILPSAARKPGAALKSFSRLNIRVILQGGSVMDYRIEARPAFRLLAKTQPQAIDNVQIPAFWDTCAADGTTARLRALSTAPDKALIGLADGASFDGASYLYYIGTPFDGGALPDGFTLRSIPASTWAIFRCVNLSDLTANEEIFRKIFTEFFPTSGYRPTDLQLEVFPHDALTHAQHVAEVWISVTPP